MHRLLTFRDLSFVIRAARLELANMMPSFEQLGIQDLHAAVNVTGLPNHSLAKQAIATPAPLKTALPGYPCGTLGTSTKSFSGAPLALLT